MTVHVLPVSLDPLIARAKRRARERRSLLMVAAIIVVSAGSFGLVRSLGASSTPLVGRAEVVRVG